MGMKNPEGLERNVERSQRGRGGDSLRFLAFHAYENSCPMQSGPILLPKAGEGQRSEQRDACHGGSP